MKGVAVAEAVYILCAVAALACTALLARAYIRTPSRLLLWSAVCFACLAVNAVLVVVDLVLVPQYSFRLLRLGVAAAGLVALLWALISESD